MRSRANYYPRRMTTDPLVSMAAYRAVRERVTSVLGGIDDGVAASTPVPGCPDWTVTEAAGHLCGVCVDILEGNLDGVGTAPWADAQAARFAPLGLAGVLAQWGEVGPQVEALAAAFPAEPATQLVFDATTHEHDIRGAVGTVGGRETAALAVPLEFLSRSLDRRVGERELPPLQLRAPDGWSFTAGPGNPRSSCGRRPSSCSAASAVAGRSTRSARSTGAPIPSRTSPSSSPDRRCVPQTSR